MASNGKIGMMFEQNTAVAVYRVNVLFMQFSFECFITTLAQSSKVQNKVLN